MEYVHDMATSRILRAISRHPCTRTSIVLLILIFIRIYGSSNIYDDTFVLSFCVDDAKKSRRENVLSVLDPV